MIKVFKILCFSKNSKLIKFLDMFSIVDIATNRDELNKLIHLNSYHFLIFDFELLNNIFENDFIKMNVFIGKIKDLLNYNSYVLIFINHEYLSNFLNNNAIDDFIINPFAESLLKYRLDLLYNKRFWNIDNNNFFYFQEEIEILINEISIYLNRLQLYFYNNLNINEINSNYDIKKGVPSSFILNIKKSNLILDLIYILNSKNIDNHMFNNISTSCKQILNLYKLNFNISYEDSFSFSLLNFTEKKAFSIFFILLVLCSYSNRDSVMINVKKSYNEIIIENDIVSILKNNHFSNILMAKLINKIPNINIIKGVIYIKCG